MLRDIQEIQNLATKYSKADLGRMVQLGIIDPQKAMMAGMMIDRIQKQNAQPPQTTVAQDVLGMAPQQQAPAPRQAPAPQQQQTAPQAGVEALPAGEVGNYAGGGIVAFDDGGDVSGKYKYGKLEVMAREAATRYGVDPDKFARLIETESHYRPGAVSYAGKDAGLGIAQISKHHGLTDAQRMDPKFALDYAAKLFSGMVGKAGGDYRKALERYKGVKTEKGRRRMEKHIAQVLGEPQQAPTRLAAATPSKAPVRKKNSKIDTIDNPFAVRDEDMPQDITPAYVEAPTGIMGVNQLAMLSEPYSDVEEEDYAGGGVVALAGGGVPSYAGGSQWGSMVGGSMMPPPGAQEQDNIQRIIEESKQRSEAETAARKAQYQQRLEAIRQKIAQGVALTPEEQTLANYNNLTPAPGISQAQINKFMDANAQLNKMLPQIAAPQGTQPEFTNAPKQDKSEYRNVAKATDEEDADTAQISKLMAGYRPNPAGYAEKLEKFTPKLAKYEQTKVPERSEISAQRKAAYAEEGVDPDFYNKLIGNIEAKKGEAASEKDRAAGEAIMLAGFKLMGARRGQEFEALSEGAQAGLKSYQGAMEKLAERQERYDSRIEALRAADQQARRTGADTDIARRDALEKAARDDKRAIFQAENRMAEVGAQIAGSLTASEINYLGHMASVGAQRQYTNALKAQGMNDANIKMVLDLAAKLHTEALKTNPNANEEESMRRAMAWFSRVGPSFGRDVNFPAPAAPSAQEYEKRYGVPPAK